MKLRSREIIDAEQFLPPNDVPKGVTNVHRNRAKFWVGSLRNTQGSIITIHAGEWVVYPKDSPEGRYFVLTDVKIKERYEEIFIDELATIKK